MPRMSGSTLSFRSDQVPRGTAFEFGRPSIDARIRHRGRTTTVCHVRTVKFSGHGYQTLIELRTVSGEVRRFYDWVGAEFDFAGEEV